MKVHAMGTATVYRQGSGAGEGVVLFSDLIESNATATLSLVPLQFEEVSHNATSVGSICTHPRSYS